jgi:chaperonin GroES
MSQTIRPLQNHLVIEKLDDKLETRAGIKLVKLVKSEPCIAKVLAVGPGEYDEDGNLHRAGVEVGDIIAYLRPMAKTFNVDNKKVTMLKFSGILGKVKNYRG